MKAEQLTTLALRVAAVIIAAYACVDLTNVVYFLIAGLHNMDSNYALPIVVGGYAVLLWSIPIITALLLWWLAPRLARLASRGTSPSVDLSSMDIERLTHGAFVVVGVWILIFGVIDLVSTGAFALMTAANPKWAGEPFAWNSFATYVLRCLFGTALILGGRNLSRLLLHLRTAGTGKS
ncbi:MAG: hypothetical protein ACRES7_10560 [Gammaproteobacteria bacterium]